jgi:hypothetical protein
MSRRSGGHSKLIIIYFKVWLRTIVFPNVIYYSLSYTVSYNALRLPLYLTCFEIYNVIFRGIFFMLLVQTNVQKTITLS